jgi:hypothetical protein
MKDEILTCHGRSVWPCVARIRLSQSMTWFVVYGVDPRAVPVWKESEHR